MWNGLGLGGLAAVILGLGVGCVVDPQAGRDEAEVDAIVGQDAVGAGGDGGALGGEGGGGLGGAGGDGGGPGGAGGGPGGAGGGGEGGAGADAGGAPGPDAGGLGGDGGGLNACPVPAVAQAHFSTHSLAIVTLDGNPSTDVDGSIARYEWVVIERPSGSTQVPMERFNNPRSPQSGGPDDDPATPTAQFFVDLAGRYVLELRVTDNFGLVAPSEDCPGRAATVTLDAVPAEGIFIQLVWDTPADPDPTGEDGTDVDLHLLHPRGRSWAQAPLDCYYANRAPDWGQPGPSGNPVLSIDASGGASPETITMAEPEDTGPLGAAYRVGVHYYRSESFGVGDLGPSTATLSIYLDGQLDHESQGLLPAGDHFWEVADIEWGPEGGRTVPLDRHHLRMPARR